MPEIPLAIPVIRHSGQGRQMVDASTTLFTAATSAWADRVAELRHRRQTFARLNTQALQMRDQAILSAYETTPEALGSSREGFVSSGGYSLMDAWAQISSPRKMVTYLPRALAIGLLAPFPWQWFDVHGSTGIMRVFAGCEMLLLYLLLPCLVLAIWRNVRRPRTEFLFLLAFTLIMLVSLSLVVANLGTLFRLRLLFLLPLLVIAAAGRPIELYRSLIERLAGIRRSTMRGERDGEGRTRPKAATATPPARVPEVVGGWSGGPGA